jgi:hypothetical protein
MFTLNAPKLSNQASDLFEGFQSLVSGVEKALEDAAPTHEVEKRVLDGLLGLGHTILEAFFAANGDGDEGETLTLETGRVLKRLAPRARTYRTIFGEFELHQVVYGTREGQRIEAVPFDARLKLPQCCTSFLLQSWNEQLMIDLPYAQANAVLERLFGVRQSVQTLERQQTTLSTGVQAFWDQHPAPPADEEGAILVHTVDAKGVPMRASETPEASGKKKMALLGGVYTINPYPRTPEAILEALFANPASSSHEHSAVPRPKPQHKQIRASLIRDEQDTTAPQTHAIFAWMGQQHQQRNPNGQRPTVILMDGQTDLWNAAWTALPGDEVAEILDILHVSSYLWEAGALLNPEPAKAREWTKEALSQVLHGQVSTLIEQMSRQGAHLKGKELEKLNRLLTYLSNNSPRMNYDVYLEAGYPIATGVIEGACRHLVKDRMERSGMRWTVQGAQALLQVRGVALSGLWEPFLDFHVDQELTRLYGKPAANDEAQVTLGKVA